MGDDVPAARQSPRHHVGGEALANRGFAGAAGAVAKIVVFQHLSQPDRRAPRGRPGRPAARRRSARSVRGTTRVAAAPPGTPFAHASSTYSPFGSRYTVGTESTSMDWRNRTLSACVGHSTCSKSPPALPRRFGDLLIEERAVVLAEPAAGLESRSRRAGRLPQTDERIDEVVEPLLGADAGEVADGERLFGFHAVAARRGRRG